MSARATRKQQLGKMGLTEFLSSKEKRHYSKALKEMYELVRLEALRTNLTPSVSENEYDDDDTVTNATYEEECSEHDSEVSELEDPETSESDKRRKPTKQTNVDQVYKELCEISKGLQKENLRLKKWDAELLEKKSQNDLLQKKLKNYEDTLDELINFECEKRCKEVEKAFEGKIVEVTEDSKRTKLSFKIMKQANDTLKKQNSQLEEHNKKLEDKVTSLNHRITNLQRKNEILKKQNDEGYKDADKITKLKERKHEEEVEAQMKKLKTEMNSCSEALNTCLQWVAESKLKQPVDAMYGSGDTSNRENDVTVEVTNERAFKILQHLSAVPSTFATPKYQLPFLEFVYWSLVHAHENQNRKVNIPLSTYRRIGEEIYKSQVFKPSTPFDKLEEGTTKQPKEGAFLHSNDMQVRIISAFIIMKTLNQADILARVLEILKADTREEKGKYLFVTHHGSSVLMSYLKGSHKGLLNYAVDVMMQMSMESPYLSSFLESLSTEVWLKTLYELFQAKLADTNLMEKLSIVLQRLSKIKYSQRYLESPHFITLIKELALKYESEKPFLALNLRSTLANLNAKTPTNIRRKYLTK